MMIKEFLKAAGVKTEKQFYKKYPTEEEFFTSFPEYAQYKNGGKVNASFGAVMANIGKEVGSIMSNSIAPGLQVLNALIPEQTGRAKVIEPQAVPMIPTNSQMLFDNGGRVNKKWKSKKSGMTAEYFDPGMAQMSPVQHLQMPVPELGGQQRYAPQQKFISYEMLSDSATGKQRSSPVFFGYSDNEIENIIPQLGYDVNSYGEWREYWNGLEAKRTRSNSQPVQPLSFNPYSGGVVSFQGPSHENGGIDIAYNGQPAEVEGGETAFKAKDGSLNIFGNMLIPSTNKKFKQAGKEIAKKENKATSVTSKAKKLMDSNDPLKQQTGALMFNSADNQLKSLAEEKESLANMQNQMLFEAEQSGIDPKDYSKQFKKGGKMYPDGGTMTSEFHKTMAIGEGMGMDYNMPGIDFNSVSVPNYTPQPSSTFVAKPAMQEVKEPPKNFIEAFKAGINAVELSGNRNAYNKKHGSASSAFGPFGFLDSSKAALQEVYEKHYRDTFPSRSALAKAMMQDGKLHEEVMSNHTLDLLSKYNGNPNAAALEHFAGPKAAKSYLMGKLNLNQRPTSNNLTYKEYLTKFRKKGFGDMNFSDGGIIAKNGYTFNQLNLTNPFEMEAPVTVKEPTQSKEYTGSFKQAFAKARKELGSNQVFQWNGNSYTTALASESKDKNYSEKVSTVRAKNQQLLANNDIFTQRPEFTESQQNYASPVYYNMTQQQTNGLPNLFSYEKPISNEEIYAAAHSGQLPIIPIQTQGKIKKYNKHQSAPINYTVYDSDRSVAEDYLTLGGLADIPMIAGSAAKGFLKFATKQMKDALQKQMMKQGLEMTEKNIHNFLQWNLQQAKKKNPYPINQWSKKPGKFETQGFSPVEEWSHTINPAMEHGWSPFNQAGLKMGKYKNGGEIPKASGGKKIFMGPTGQYENYQWRFDKNPVPTQYMATEQPKNQYNPYDFSRGVIGSNEQIQTKLSGDEKPKKKPTSLANQNKLSPFDFMGEAAALLQRPQKVAPFQYQPQFFQNYQTSMDQQRYDLNASTRGMERQFQNNPAALAQLHANKLDAMNQINNQEFQTNQQLKADTYNRNTAMANESALQNIGFQSQAQQMNLQSEANTRRQQMNALGSIGNKINFNKAENSRIRMSEDMTGFMYMPGANGQQGQWVRTGDQYQVSPTSSGMSNPNTISDDLLQMNGKKYKKTVDSSGKETLVEYGENGLKMLDIKYKNAFMYGGKFRGKKC